MMRSTRLLRLAMALVVLVLLPSCGKKGDPLPSAATSGVISGLQASDAEKGGVTMDIQTSKGDTRRGATGG